MPEWIIEFLDKDAASKLQLMLEADLAPAAKSGRVEIIKYLVSRVKNLKIEVFANEHPPPHFRVSANGETANYRIDTCAQLTGGLERHHGTIKRWHKENRPLLIEAWNRMRPSNCPVGPYRAA
jgi:hypothetical protein